MKAFALAVTLIASCAGTAAAAPKYQLTYNGSFAFMQVDWNTVRYSPNDVIVAPAALPEAKPVRTIKLLPASDGAHYVAPDQLSFADGDLDCADIGRSVRVATGDPHRLDADGDGIGCEDY